MGQLLSRIQNNRSARTLREIAPPRVPGHEAAIPQLSRDTLVAGLQRVAAYIRSKGGNVTVIAVGGAINTILLRSRDSTHDVDFFNDHLTRQEAELILRGAREASSHDRRLAEEWFNNRTILFIPRDLRATLTDESLHHREVVFAAPGLTVLAAPWNYAFCCKVDRISGQGMHDARPYDLSDAIQYIHRYVQQHRITHVRRGDVQAWFTRFSLRWSNNTEAVITRVNQGYRQHYRVNHDVIV